jgi:hypothetical protein
MEDPTALERKEDSENQALLTILNDLEGKLRSRIPLVMQRSPESLFEELEALELVIDLRKKLS